MADRSGQQIDKYRLLRLLGQGAFGEVYFAEDSYRKTQVALKLLNMRLTNEEIPAFLNEARNFRLKHPHIIPIVDFGIDSASNTAFLVMEYAPGGTVRHRHPKGTQVPLATVVHYVKQMASALHYAHEEHLVHRDVKPENMLISRQQELLLSDFGVAVIVQTSRPTLQPATYSIGGTPYYMAPEQFRGKSSPSSDQYALAIVVYEWLTGTLPFTEGDFIQLGYQHNFETPPPLRDKVPAIPLAVEQVVMRALAKDPGQRFVSVQTFADALEQAYQRLPRGTPLCTYGGHSSPIFMLAWSPDGRRIVSADGRGVIQVWDPLNGKTLFTYSGHSQRVDTVAWSPDGRRIASGGDEKTIHLWDAATGSNVLICQGHSSVVWDVAWSPDGFHIASASEDQSVQLWDTATGRKLFTYQGYPDAVYRVAWSPDGKRIALGGNTPIVQIWDAFARGIILTYRGHSSWVKALKWAPDGKRIASGSHDNTVQVWDAMTGHLLLTYKGHTAEVYAVSWSPNGEYMASASADGTVQVWETQRGTSLFTYRGHRSWVGAVAWSPHEQRVASGGMDRTIQVWQA